MTRKIVEKASFVPTWNSFVGVLAGTLKALGDKRELNYIAGMSGFPFRLTINKQVCPSSPTTGWSWTDDMLSALQLLGYRGEAYFAYKTDKQYDNVKGEVRRLVEGSIDEDRPVIIWDTLVPEFAIMPMLGQLILAEHQRLMRRGRRGQTQHLGGVDGKEQDQHGQQPLGNQPPPPPQSQPRAARRAPRQSLAEQPSNSLVCFCGQAHRREGGVEGGAQSLTQCA